MGIIIGSDLAGGEKMLVILTESQILPPQRVCQGCLLADQGGQPRSLNGKPTCAYALNNLATQQATQYECHMGFRLAEVN